MNLSIQENGCCDKEITLLDTRLPYFYDRVKGLFPHEPEEVRIVLVKDKEQFCTLKGESGEECGESAFCKGNAIYIYEPHLFGVATSRARDQFYEVLYRELVYLFYKANRLSRSS
mgnify:CR=1 FL=1